REDVVVVEDRRAARQCELRDPATGGRVLHPLVDPRPHRVQGLQPGEEVAVRHTGTRERLVQVVVRVDEAGRDDRAAQVLAALRGARRAELRDQPVLDPQPPAAVLGAGVVHRHEPAVLQDHGASTASGTSSNRSTSTSPRSVSFSLGITDSARNDRSWKGASTVEPSSCAAATIARLRATTSSSGASDSSPATGSGSSASTCAPSTTTMPPPMFASRRTAAAIAASLIPTTTTLCASCATVDAIAPRRRPKPRTSPRPVRPVPRWRSITAIFARSRLASATASP